MEKTKVILLLAALLVLLVGAVSASDVSNDTLGADAPESIATDTPAQEEVAVQKQATPAMDVQENTVKSNENIREEKTLKTASSYDVITYQELHDALTNLDDEYITVNIKDNIKLNGTIMLEAIDVTSPIHVTINGEGKTIDGDHKHYFMNIHSPLLEVTVNNLTISNCTGAPSLVDDSQLTAGGAIRNYATLTVNNTRFVGNNAELYGGAIWNHDTLIVDNSEFNNNTAHADNLGSNNGVGQGGAIYGGSVIINNTRFASNNADNGGAIFIDSGNLTVDNTEFTGNHAENGGGAIYIGSTSTVTNTVFNNNTAERLGGAINNGGTLIVDSTEFANNNAHGLCIEYDEIVGGYLMSGGYGGAISNAGTGNLTVNNTVFTGNHADNYGGAIDTTAYSNLTVTNTRFNNNHADWWGGAIYYTNASEPSGLGEFHPHEIGSYNITDTTFYKNTPANFIINQDNYIDLEENANYINVSNIAVIVDGEEIYNGPLYIDGGNGPELIAYCEIPEGNHLVKLIVNGTNIINNEYILSDTIDVTYQGLIDVIEEATTDITIKLQDDVSYNVLETITLDKPGITITIDGNGQTINGMQKQVFHINSGSSLVLNNITITNGQADMGGAIYNEGTLTIINSTLSNNNATWGGAIENSHGNLTITGSTLENNIATSTVEDTFEAYARGGAISNLYGNVTITNTTINNNQATATGGDVTANAYAGAISNLYGNVTITDSTINNNKATATATGNWDVTANAFGGVIYNTGTLTVTDSTLENNQATATATSTEEYITVGANALGGTIYNDGGILTVNDTQFANNTASSGGAIYSFMGNLTMTDTQFANNAATSEGGAIYTDMDNLTINNTNLINNNAQFGGAIYNKEASLNCTNSTFDMNTPANYNINDEDHIQLNNTNNYIPEDATYAIYLDNEEECVYTESLNGYTVPKNHVIRLVVNGSDTNVFGDNTFILYTYDRIVRNYTQLVEAVGDAKRSLEEEYSIYLLPGDYNATANMTWGSESGSAPKLIINGNGLTLDGINTYQFMKVDSGYNLTLYNITLINYNAKKGGAIHNYHGTLNILDSNLTGNTASGQTYGEGFGGAIYNEGNLTITGSNFTGNIATGKEYGRGGAIINYGNLSITGSKFTENIATGRNTYGGAICTVGSATLNITGSVFSNNTATGRNGYGGAIYMGGNSLSCTNSTFDMNTPANYIINDEEHIQLDKKDGYIPEYYNYTIYLDDEEECVYTGPLDGYTVPENHKIRLVGSGAFVTNFNNIDYDNNTFILYTYDRIVRNYTQLVEAVEETKISLEEEYSIYLLPGDYNATANMTWGSESGSIPKLIINGNGLTLDGINTYQFMKVEYHSTLILYNITITNYCGQGYGSVIDNTDSTVIITDSNITHNTAKGEYENGRAITNLLGNISITNSNLSDNTAGAIYNNGGTVNITCSNILNNAATWRGSAIANDVGGIITIAESNFTNNAAKYGGAIFNNGGTIVITGSDFSYNNATIAGSAIANDEGTVNITTSNFTHNIAYSGGAIYNYANGVVNIIYSKFINDTANNGNGGAIYNNATMTINHTQLEYNNVIGGLGGAIYNLATLMISDAALSYNNASRGGAVYNNHASMTMSDSILENNTADNEGGAIYNENGIINITGSIFTSNTAANASAISNYGSASIYNNTFKTNNANMDGTAIIDESQNAEIRDNINDEISVYPGTIYTKGEEVSIIRNIFDDGIIYTTMEINVNNTNPYLFDEVEISLLLKDHFNKTIPNQVINLEVGDKTYTVTTNTDGIATQKHTITSIVTDAIAVFTGNDEYNKTGNSTVINAQKLNTKLTLTTSNSTPLNNTQMTITITLTDAKNNKVSNQDILLNIAGINVTVKTNNNGTVTYKYTPTTLGKQTITATYKGNSHYNNSTKTTSITVKTGTILTLTVSNVTPVNSTPITITATLTDTNNNKLANRNITFTIDDKTYTTPTNNEGIATQTYTPTNPGKQTITAKYNGDSQHNSNTATVTITVKKINTKITVNTSNTTPINNTQVNITVTLTDENNNKMVNQNITITVDGKTFNVKTNGDGVATQNYTPTKVETQTVTAKYNGDSRYNNSSANTIITVKKINTKITVNTSNTTPINNTQVNITATLTDTNGNKLAGQNITITIAGKTYTVKTDNNGVAIKSYTPTTLGKQTITATYKGDSKYNNSASNTSITVKKINTKLVVKASNITPTLNTSINITATLTDTNGNKLSGQNVTITIAGKTYTVKTNSNGVATKAYTPTTVGKQTITISYNGDSKYNNITNTTNITVNKINTKLALKVSNNTPKVSDTISITATLTDATGNKVAGQNITITVEDKTYTVKTNNNGIATQTHKLTRAGFTNITAKYNGNNNYNSSNTSTKITVKKSMQNTSMTITVNNTRPRVNDNVLVTFTLKDEKNNPIKNQEIKVTINGINTTVKTNNNGMATTNYTVAKKDKNITITATYNGNTTLKATTCNLSLDRYYKVDMELLTGSFDSKPGQTVKLIAHIKDNGVDIDGGQLVFKLNGVSLKDENGSAVIVNIKKGLAVLEYKIPDTLGARTHNLTAVYASNTYGRVELTTPMTIGKYTTHIDVNPLYTTMDKITIKAQIVDQNNQALNKQTTISIKVNGKSYSLNTINGTIDYTITQTLKDGYYNITIISGENGKYLGANVKTVLIKSNTTIKTNYINNTLNKDTTAKSGDTKTSNIMSILTGASTVKPGDRLKLIAHLSEDQVDITGGQLVFKLNGVSLKDENGNAVVVNINNGLGILDYKIPDTLGARTHNLTAVYSSKQYGRVELTTQLTMNRLNTHIEAEPIYTTGTTSYIKAKILDDNNQLINKQTSVVIKVDGKSYAFNTTTGSINYKVPNTLSKGLHQITIISGENGKYISSRANTVLIKT